jgi:sterol 3beta-glucosyltransferase
MQKSIIELPPARKPQLEREMLAMLEGNKEKDRPQTSSRHSSQQGIVPSEEDDIDWDVPPPYEQLFGNDQRNVSTTVEGMWHMRWNEGERANFCFPDNGRISMFFGGPGDRYPTLPPLPVYDPRMGQVRSSATEPYPLLNIAIQVVGSRGMWHTTPLIVELTNIDDVNRRCPTIHCSWARTPSCRTPYTNRNSQYF